MLKSLLNPKESKVRTSQAGIREMGEGERRAAEPHLTRGPQHPHSVLAGGLN